MFEGLCGGGVMFSKGNFFSSLVSAAAPRSRLKTFDFLRSCCFVFFLNLSSSVKETTSSSISTVSTPAERTVSASAMTEVDCEKILLEFFMEKEGRPVTILEVRSFLSSQKRKTSAPFFRFCRRTPWKSSCPLPSSS